ncbi:MAG: hypothetical protein JST91_15475 [Actinobacteria bacterium]|nr:hypothetical protein [Actinomycetota bacterium]
MRTIAATLFAALTATVVPLVIAPAAQADVCGDVGGRHVEVGGCTDIAGDVVAGATVATDDDAAAQAAAGLPPCYTPAGVPYYTPAGYPCN